MFNSLVRFPASSSAAFDWQREIFDAFRDFGLEVIGTDRFPLYNCRYDKDKNLILELAVAGYSKDRLTIELVDGDTLVIKGEGRTDISADSYTIQNISNKNFTKNFRLTREVEVKNVALEDGILIITLGVKGEKDNRQIFKPI